MVGVVGNVVSITVLHYTTSLHSVLLHQVFQRLHYLPIVVATDYRHEASSRHCCPGVVRRSGGVSFSLGTLLPITVCFRAPRRRRGV